MNFMTTTQWSPDKVDQLVDGMINELGRTPKSKEFSIKYRGAADYIFKGKYNPEIRTWSGYLTLRNIKPNVIFWTPERVDESFDKLAENLGRIPTQEELQGLGGAVNYITHRKYRPEIETYQQYLKHRNVTPRMTWWTPQMVDGTFDNMTNDLGRPPKNLEFRGKFSGAEAFIKRGDYKPCIRTWNQYLQYRKVKVKKRSLILYTPEEIDHTFDGLKNELGRIPTSPEFDKKLKGGVKFVAGGRYHNDVNTWNQYLEYRGVGAQRAFWTAKEVDEVVDKLRDELGRVPSQREFGRRFGGVMNYIRRGDYNKSIRTWSEYLEYRKFKQGGRIKNTGQLQRLFEREEIARLVAERFAQPEDVADILAVIYSGRIEREDLMDLLETPSLRDYLGPIRKPDIGIGELAEAGTHLLKLDKGGVIFDIIMRRAQELRRERLGANPSPETRESFLRELETELHELVGA